MSPSLICRPPDISETTTARKLNLKIPLDMVKYPLWNFGYKYYYIIRYNMRAAAILIFNKCLYLRGRLRLTTARRLSAYMSSRALATTTAYSYYYIIIIVCCASEVTVNQRWFDSCSCSCSCVVPTSTRRAHQTSSQLITMPLCSLASYRRQQCSCDYQTAMCAERPASERSVSRRHKHSSS